MSISFLLAALLSTPASPAAAPPEGAATAKPEPAGARWFKPQSDAEAMGAVDAAMAAAQRDGRRVLIVMGTARCHDSSHFAALMDDPRFAALVAARFHLVYVDVGLPPRGIKGNESVPRRFGFKKIKGTPTIALIDALGKVLNRRAAPRWRNAASRSDDAIFDELMRYGAMT